MKVRAANANHPATGADLPETWSGEFRLDNVDDSRGADNYLTHLSPSFVIERLAALLEQHS